MSAHEPNGDSSRARIVSSDTPNESETSGGVPARGYSWPAFERGNRAALRHGAYSTLGLAEREEELLGELLAVAPVVSPADVPMYKLLAAALGRWERATAALAQFDEAAKNPASLYVESADGRASVVERIRHDQVRWMNAARKLANDLGLSPTSRLRMGLDLALTRKTMSVVEYYAGREQEDDAA
jgi:hypothetical protein